MNDTIDEKPSLWARIREYFAEIADGASIGEWFRGPPEKSVRFAIAIIALAAKMAKADGRVTITEVRTLRQIFVFDERDEKEIARVFDLARQDVAGYESYAERIYRMFRDSPEMLQDIFESLFVISLADDEFHENEEIMLEHIADIFKLDPKFFGCLKNRYKLDSDHDPYQILGVDASASPSEIKSAYHQIIRDNHPDALRARGLPDETIALAEVRVRAANEAYDQLGLK